MVIWRGTPLNNTEGRHFFYLTTYSTHFVYGYMVKDHSYSKKGNPLPPLLALLFPIGGWGGGVGVANELNAHIH